MYPDKSFHILSAKHHSVPYFLHLMLDTAATNTSDSNAIIGFSKPFPGTDLMNSNCHLDYWSRPPSWWDPNWSDLHNSGLDKLFQLRVAEWRGPVRRTDTVTGRRAGRERGAVVRSPDMVSWSQPTDGGTHTVRYESETVRQQDSKTARRQDSKTARG